MASLDILSDGRVELGIGAGGYWDAIATYGADPRTRRQALAALEEAIGVIRAIWAPPGPIDRNGAHYLLDGARPGPEPAHPIGIWVARVGRGGRGADPGRRGAVGRRDGPARAPLRFRHVHVLGGAPRAEQVTRFAEQVVPRARALAAPRRVGAAP